MLFTSAPSHVLLKNYAKILNLVAYPHPETGNPHTAFYLIDKLRMLAKSSGENPALSRWENRDWVKGRSSLASSPSPAEHTAHRWCQNLSEKQDLSGGKFPVPDWTENKTNIKKIGQQVVLACTVLGDSESDKSRKEFSSEV